MACEVIPTPESFAPGMIGFLDCQAQTLGSAGWQALAAPGSVGAVVLAGLVTLLVAVAGYRMLLGQVPSTREAVLTFVRLGIVLALATSWPAFQVLIYDVVLRAPAELMAAIGGAAGLPGAGGGLVARLDGVDHALASLAIAGVGAPPVGPDGTAIMPGVAPPPFLGFDSFALGMSRAGFLVGAVGGFAVVRLAAGLLLALGPIFVGFLLFDGTRGLFEGWLKALLGTALASLAITLVLAVELALLEPWLATLLARRASDLDIIGVPAQLLSATLVFAIALGAVAIILARVAVGFALRRGEPTTDAEAQRSRRTTLFSSTSTQAGAPAADRSRAAAIVDAVATMQRRENGTSSLTGTSWNSAAAGARSGRAPAQGEAIARSPTATSSVRNRRRVSAGAGQRDRR